MRHRAFALLIACAGLLALLPLRAQPQLPEQATGGQERAKLHRQAERAIPNQYIVVLDQDADGDVVGTARKAEALLSARGRAANQIWAHALKGFSVEMTEEEALALADDPDVAYVEEDAVMEINVTQTGATWGLDRIDQRSRPLSGTYSYTTTGAGVNVYVIDTGIRRTHSDFGGRASVAFDVIGDGRNGNDCNGHGTHVAGTIGGTTWGVAKSVRLFAVRVLNCSGSGTTSGVISGVNWVTAHRVKPAVANMSLGGGASNSLDTAVSNSIAAGVTYAVAAGNSNANAASFSPARVGAAITVGASTSSDARSSFSNFGSVVDVFAPGSSIRSAWLTSDTATAVLSGTSMASPHVAGVAARILQSSPGASPATVRNTIVNNATTNVLTGVPSSTPNRLLFRSPTQ
jgi:subtilisin family serine protease